MRLVAMGLASTHWASLGVQHDQLTEEVVGGRHVHRVVGGGGREDNDGACLPLRDGAVRSAALVSHPSNTSTPSLTQTAFEATFQSTLQTAIVTLKSTNDESIEAAATLAALFKPDILNLL